MKENTAIHQRDVVFPEHTDKATVALSQECIVEIQVMLYTFYLLGEPQPEPNQDPRYYGLT